MTVCFVCFEGIPIQYKNTLRDSNLCSRLKKKTVIFINEGNTLKRLNEFS